MPTWVPKVKTDSRLDVHVTYKSTTTRVSDVVSVLSRYGRLKLVAEGEEVALTPVCSDYKDIPPKDILDSIGSLHRWLWQRQDKNTLVLHAAPPSAASTNRFR